MSIKKLNKRAILLTGTIIPNSIYTEHINQVERLNEYIVAIKFYLDTFKHDDLYFLENSEYDLQNDDKINELLLNKRFRILKFKKSDKYFEGKGYQEFEMIDAAVSKLQNEYQALLKLREDTSLKMHLKLPILTVKDL